MYKCFLDQQIDFLERKYYKPNLKRVKIEKILFVWAVGWNFF